MQLDDNGKTMLAASRYIWQDQPKPIHSFIKPVVLFVPPKEIDDEMLHSVACEGFGVWSTAQNTHAFNFGALPQAESGV